MQRWYHMSVMLISMLISSEKIRYVYINYVNSTSVIINSSFRSRVDVFFFVLSIKLK